jgi:outer membrane protein assembly factor BamB
MPVRVALTVAGLTAMLTAADWPQFLGPNRNGIAAETRVLTRWPAAGPTLLWQRQVGQGYSGPAVAGNRLILFHRLDDREVVECLRADTGDLLWKYVYPTGYRDDFGFDEGPRATPLFHDRYVITLGAEGHLVCLEAATGNKVWDLNVNERYEVQKGFFGVTCSPIVEAGLVCVNVGGPRAGIVAFDVHSGREVWRATDHPASNASPVSATIRGEQHLLFFTREGLVSLEPTTGRVRFSRRWRPRIHASVNAASPVVAGDLIFVSTCYDTGSLVVRVTPQGLEEVWHNDESLTNHYNTSVHYQGLLFGIHGRQEYGPSLRCIELATGKVRWSRERFGCASLTLVGDKLLALSEKGELIALQATGEEYRELARAKVLGEPLRAHPAFSNGRFYARDGRRLICLDLRETP